MVVPLPPPQRHHLDKLEHVHSDQQGFHGHPHLVAPKRTPEMRKTADPAGGDPENESPTSEEFSFFFYKKRGVFISDE